MPRCRGERGAVMVELALVLPVLVLLVFGIVEFGRGYNASIQLTSAVREGARERALGGDDVATEAATRLAATGLTTSDIVVTSSGCSSGPNASVTATYPFHYDIPLFRSATVTLTATGVMRCGG